MDGGELMSADMVITRKRKWKTRISSSSCCCFSLAQLLMLEIQYQGRRRRRNSSGHYFSDAIQCLMLLLYSLGFALVFAYT